MATDFRQPGAHGPGKVIAIEAARYGNPAALVLPQEFIGLLGCAFCVVKP
ncbi:hypothetical protein V6571_003469 [Enterobacter hormaechei subsp. xiangfangensis]